MDAPIDLAGGFMSAARIWTTRDICEEVTRRYNLDNINQLADKFGVAFNTVRNWTRGGTMDSDQIETAATLLDADPEWIAFCLAPERIKNDKLAARMRNWLALHATAASLAVAVFSVLFVSSLMPAHAVAAGGLCILCSISWGRLRRPSAHQTGQSVPTGTLRPFVGNLHTC